MKAIITAGGKGSRLRPLTYTINKHLIPVANKEMIIYAIEKVSKAGIKEIAININPGDNQISNLLGDGSKWGIKITYIEQEGGALGLAHILKNSLDWIAGDEILMYLGDNIIFNDLDHIIKKYKEEKSNCMLTLSKVHDPERFGVPEIKDGKIISVEEKPQNPKSQFAITGIYIYDKNLKHALKNIKKSARGEYEITEIHQWYIDNNYKVNYTEITGWWKDTGKPEDLLLCNALLLQETKTNIETDKSNISPTAVIQGQVHIGKNTKIGDNVLIRGPVNIDSDCILENCYIGPYTSIGKNVEIYNAEIENSIIIHYSDINCNKKIVDSLIGMNTTITDLQLTRPAGHKLILGENSRIEL